MGVLRGPLQYFQYIGEVDMYLHDMRSLEMSSFERKCNKGKIYVSFSHFHCVNFLANNMDYDLEIVEEKSSVLSKLKRGLHVLAKDKIDSKAGDYCVIVEIDHQLEEVIVRWDASGRVNTLPLEEKLFELLPEDRKRTRGTKSHSSSSSDFKRTRIEDEHFLPTVSGACSSSFVPIPAATIQTTASTRVCDVGRRMAYCPFDKVEYATNKKAFDARLVSVSVILANIKRDESIAGIGM